MILARVFTVAYNSVCVTIIRKIKSTINPKILIEIKIADFIKIEKYLYIHNIFNQLAISKINLGYR